MPDNTPVFFISYSSPDRRYAEEIKNRLTGRGADVWVDYERIEPGAPILTRISEGLSESDVLVFLLSRHSGNSPWCRKEYEVALSRELIRGETVVVPIRLDDSHIPEILRDKRYLSFGEMDEWLHELFAVAKGGKLPERAQSPEPSVPAPRPEVLNGLAVLLLLDQFELGVWGRSLAKLGAAYGHAEDPGSITISGWAADALRMLQPTGTIPELERFSRYLDKRRDDATGAVGMLKEVGSPFAKDSMIVENRRHTAVAALYLHRHESRLAEALRSLRYVIEERTPRGAWNAIGEVDDESADPLTTSYVLSVLRTFEREGLLSGIGIEDRELFLAQYWKAGLLWLYENLLASGGWWKYKDPGRTYCYTTDVLLMVPEFWLSDQDFEREHEALVGRLDRLWRKGAFGLPSGPGVETPNLEASAQFAAAVWKCRIRYPALNEEIQSSFVENLEDLLSDGESDAAGWALTISHLSKVAGAMAGARTLPDLRSASEQVKEGSETSLPRWVVDIAHRDIFPVDTEPP